MGPRGWYALVQRIRGVTNPHELADFDGNLFLLCTSDILIARLVMWSRTRVPPCEPDLFRACHCALRNGTFPM
jgi:hypothetical protein